MGLCLYIHLEHVIYRFRKTTTMVLLRNPYGIGHKPLVITTLKGGGRHKSLMVVQSSEVRWYVFATC